MKRAEVAWETVVKFIIVIAAVFVALIIAKPLLEKGVQAILNWKV